MSLARTDLIRYIPQITTGPGWERGLGDYFTNKFLSNKQSRVQQFTVSQLSSGEICSLYSNQPKYPGRY